MRVDEEQVKIERLHWTLVRSFDSSLDPYVSGSADASRRITLSTHVKYLRTYEYSVEEKSALVAIESILLGAGYTAHKAASYIADIWHKQGPVRESWDFENRMHAVRRLLKRMKEPKS